MNPGRADPALPAGAPAVPADAVGGGAASASDVLALAPEVERADALLGVAALPNGALPVVVSATPREQLKAAGMHADRITAVVRAARSFNGAVSDGRSVDELTLGLLWLAEGGATLTITLDPADTKRNFRGLIDILIALGAAPPEYRRMWRITAVGLWGFGLDDIVALPEGSRITAFDPTESETRWQSRLRDNAGWTRAVPFTAVVAATAPPVVTRMQTVAVAFTDAEAHGFLVTVAARFATQLQALPAELAARGITISTTTVSDIPLVEPVLAYMCYFQRASRAAAVWETLIFLLEFCGAISVAAPVPTDPAPRYELFHLIDVLNRWLDRLRSIEFDSLSDLLRILVRDTVATAPGGRNGRTVLADVAARADWDPIPPQAMLDPAGTTLLHELVDAWLGFARHVAGMHAPGQLMLTPGELFYQGTNGAEGSTPLVNEFGKLGYGAKNYGGRFRKATGLAVGGGYRRTVGAAAP